MPILIIILVAVVVGFAGTAFFKSGPDENDELLAKIRTDCQTAVAAEMSSPGTAHFPRPHERYWVGDIAVSAGAVEAQNMFGAAVRKKYRCDWENGEFTSVLIY